MSRYSRRPYQSTTATCAHVHQQYPSSHHQIRNPWLADPYQLGAECRESQSTTNSSSSSRTYRGVWPHNHRAVPPHHIQVVAEGPYPGEEAVNAVLQPPSSSVTIVSGLGRPHHATSSSRATSDRDRPVTPASSPGGFSGSGGAVDGCGGHCVAFENFCYYCLQMVFVAGILTGVSLIIAGSVLRGQQRGDDLLVLVYIGCLVGFVCAVLLSVQCCVRRNVKRRKRALRGNARGDRRRPVPIPESIPLQDLSNHQQHTALTHPNIYEPAAIGLVRQQENPTVILDNQRHLLYRHQPTYIRSSTTFPSTSIPTQLDDSYNGTYFWRRQEHNRQQIAESRH